MGRGEGGKGGHSLGRGYRLRFVKLFEPLFFFIAKLSILHCFFSFRFIKIRVSIKEKDGD